MKTEIILHIDSSIIACLNYIEVELSKSLLFLIYVVEKMYICYTYNLSLNTNIVLFFKWQYINYILKKDYHLLGIEMIIIQWWLYKIKKKLQQVNESEINIQEKSNDCLQFT